MNRFIFIPGLIMMIIGLGFVISDIVHIQGGFNGAKAKAEAILAPYPVENQKYLSPAEHLEAIKDKYPEATYNEVKAQYDKEIQPFVDTGYNNALLGFGFVIPGMLLVSISLGYDLIHVKKNEVGN